MNSFMPKDKYMRNRNNMIILIILFGIFLVGVGLFVAASFYYTDTRMYENNWNIVLPQDLKRQYHISSLGPFNDGFSYTIYELKDANQAFLDQTSSQKDIQMQNDVIKILKSLKVDTDKYPDFSHPYKWKILSDYSKRLYIIYDTKSLYVYFVQNTE